MPSFWQKSALRHSLASLLEKLSHPHLPQGEALFALQLIEALYSAHLMQAVRLGLLSVHPSVQVLSIRKCEEKQYLALLPQLREIVGNPSQALIVRNSALIAILGLSPTEGMALAKSYPQLVHGLAYGLLKHNLDRPQGIVLVHELLKNPQTVLFAIDAVCRFRLFELYEELLPLFSHPQLSIRRYVAQSVGSVGYEGFIAPLLELLKGETAFRQAASSLIRFGDLALDAMRSEFVHPHSSRYLSRLVRIAGKIASPKAEALLLEWLCEKNLQSDILMALRGLQFKSKSPKQTKFLLDEAEKQLSFAYQLLQSICILEKSPHRFELLERALMMEQETALCKAAQLLSFVLPNSPGSFESTEEWLATQIGALESLHNPKLAKKVSLFASDAPLQRKAHDLAEFYHYPIHSPTEVISTILQYLPEFSPFSVWTQAVALYSLTELPSPHLLKRLAALLDHPNTFLAKSAFVSLQKIAQDKAMTLHELLDKLFPHKTVENLRRSFASQRLLDIEKVIILKRTRLFAQTPESVLIDIVKLVKEVKLPKDTVVFEKGSAGDCMYIIYDGQVKIHVGDYRLSTLINGDFFGELGLLDGGERSATATCETDTLLLRLDQEDFYELNESRPEVAKGVIKALCEMIRYQSENIAGFRTPQNRSL